MCHFCALQTEAVSNLSQRACLHGTWLSSVSLQYHQQTSRRGSSCFEYQELLMPMSVCSQNCLPDNTTKGHEQDSRALIDSEQHWLWLSTALSDMWQSGTHCRGSVSVASAACRCCNACEARSYSARAGSLKSLLRLWGLADVDGSSCELAVGLFNSGGCACCGAQDSE